MTQAQRDAISGPTQGMLVFNTDTQALNVYNATSSLWSAVGAGGGGGVYATASNLLVNGGFELGTGSWTASGGTYTTTSTAANLDAGTLSGSWDSNASSQTLISSVSYTNGGGPTLRNMVASCDFKCDSGTCTHTITADDGTNNLATPQTITSSTTGFIRTSVNFIAPTSGTIRLTVTSVASNEPTLYIDQCYLGSADGINLSQVSQAALFGTATWVGASSCTWTTTSSTFANYTANTNCSAPTVTGSATAPGTKIPAIVFPSLPVGHYLIVATGNFWNLAGAAGVAYWRFSDGTNFSSVNSSYKRFLCRFFNRICRGLS